MEKDKNLESVFKELHFEEPSSTFTASIMKNSLAHNRASVIDRKQVIALTLGLISFGIILSTIATLFIKGYFHQVTEFLFNAITHLLSALNLSLPNFAFFLIIPFLLFRIILVAVAINSKQLLIVKK